MRRFKRLILPPAGPLLLAAAGLLLFPTRLVTLGAASTAFGIVCAWILATPACGLFLLRRLERHPPLDLATVPPNGAIVILDGGRSPGAREWSRDGFAAPKPQTLERLRYGAELQRVTGLPVLVSGDGAGELMVRSLERDFGVPCRFAETRSRNTQENASFSAAILLPAGFRRIVLVTHFWHLPRAAAAFRREGFEVIPAPMGFAGRERADRSFFAWLPSPAGVVASYWALHEAIGLLFYRLRYRARG